MRLNCTRQALMAHHVGLMWGAHVPVWGLVIALSAGRATSREWTAALIVAATLSQGALYATFVRLRVDRMTRALASAAVAAMRQPSPGPAHLAPVAEVVPLRAAAGTDRPWRAG